tara:strand:+ start:1464 stop:1631 length:168 start_codon:yes stop_codon:yes gene_type:complete
MKLYLAFMRIDYEGIYEDNMKLFKSKTEAGKYICALRKEHGTYTITYEIKEMEVN